MSDSDDDGVQSLTSGQSSYLSSSSSSDSEDDEYNEEEKHVPSITDNDHTLNK